MTYAAGAFEIIPPTGAVVASVEAVHLPAVTPDSVNMPRWRRVGASLMVCASLVAGCMNPKTEEPERVVGRHAPTSGIVRAADAGPIELGAIIVRAEGDTTPAHGLTEEAVMRHTADAQGDISEATDDAVEFKSPKFYGNHVIKVDNPELACATEEGERPVREFEKQMIAGAGKAAAAAGYVASETSGLILFVDADCRNLVRSNVPLWEGSNRSIYITDDPANKDYLVPHEIGHWLGLHGHANQYMGDGLGLLTPAARFDIANNPRSVMGQNPSFGENTKYTFTGYELLQLGVIKPEEVTKLDAPGTYTVQLAEATSSHPAGAKLIRLPRYGAPKNGSEAAKDFLPYYWVELSHAPQRREHPGYAAGKGAVPLPRYPQELGVTITVADSGDNRFGSDSGLVTLEPLRDPGAGAATRASEGRTIFQDPYTGIRIRLDTINQAEETAVVTIDFAGHPRPLLPTPPR